MRCRGFIFLTACSWDKIIFRDVPCSSGRLKCEIRHSRTDELSAIQVQLSCLDLVERFLHTSHRRYLCETIPITVWQIREAVARDSVKVWKHSYYHNNFVWLCKGSIAREFQIHRWNWDVSCDTLYLTILWKASLYQRSCQNPQSLNTWITHFAPSFMLRRQAPQILHVAGVHSV